MLSFTQPNKRPLKHVAAVAFPFGSHPLPLALLNLVKKLAMATPYEQFFKSWAPQAQVLAHKSISVFVTHCGANSVYESLANGVPMICRPVVFADNVTNAKIIEDIWEAGVRVDGGVFTKNGVIKSLELIFAHEQGRRIRRKAQALQELLLQAAAPTGHAAQDFKTLLEIVSSNHALNN